MPSSSCDAVIGNEDLVTQILLRLPVKYVLRCKCVCKKWLAIISDPQFSYSHTLRLCRNPYPHALLLEKIEDQIREVKAHIVPFTSADDVKQSPARIIPLFNLECAPTLTIFTIKQSCNGLLLCCRSRYYGQHYPRDDSCMVCNLATSQYVNLWHLWGDRYAHSYFPYIAFEPLRSPHYKVIVFDEVKVGDYFEPTIKTGVYSSETGSLDEVRVCCSASPEIFDKSGVYCNGAIHWYNLGKDLVYFDTHHLCFNKLSGPTFADTSGACVKYFGESGGHLHLILANSDGSLDFDIWELKEDYSGWIVRYHVNLNLMGEGGATVWHANPSPFSVLCVVRQANEEHSMLVLFVDSKIMSYNLEDHTSRILHEADEVPTSFQYFDTLSCVGLDYTHDFKDSVL